MDDQMGVREHAAGKFVPRADGVERHLGQPSRKKHSKKGVIGGRLVRFGAFDPGHAPTNIEPRANGAS